LDRTDPDRQHKSSFCILQFSILLQTPVSESIFIPFKKNKKATMKQLRTDRSNTIAIIGCGGFIGSHLLDRILGTTSYSVIGVDLASKKIAGHLDNDRFTFVNKDMHDLGAMDSVIHKSGTVFMLAALCNPSLYNTRPLDVIDVNSTGSLPLVAMCAESNARLVYFSTSEVYGRTARSLVGEEMKDRDDDPAGALLSEDTSPMILGPVSAQRWCYACAKQLMERTIFAFGKERGLDYTIVRPFNFIGPRMDFIPGIDGEGVPRVLACFLSALMAGQPLQLVDGGRNRRAFTYIGDAIDACMKIIERGNAASRRIFNIGNPANETDIAGLAERMIRIWRELVPDQAGGTIGTRVVTAEDFYGPGYEDSDRRVPAIDKARSLLGWEPETDLDDALRLTLRACLDHYGAARRKG
jgi:UDP-apiose/xylose synthase